MLNRSPADGVGHGRDGRAVLDVDPAVAGAEPQRARAAGHAHERRAAAARPRPPAARARARRARRAQRQVARCGGWIAKSYCTLSNVTRHTLMY